MPENARLNGRIDQIDLDFVEREATPPLLMKLSIQLHLAGLSLSNTVRVLDIFGVDRARSTVHNWVHKADLQPESGHNPDHVAVDETVIQLDDEQYWLYAAVDPDSNDYSTHDSNRLRTALLQNRSLRSFVRNTRSKTPSFSSTVPHHLRQAATDTVSAITTRNTATETVSNVSSER
jgi:putative transposase